ncbi:hypothetical protein FB451DRAFT_1415196 [Mycena latifolia]|nr:hypothetical protein FB451DRAFT_1415196 [Mycena latifolia]
MHKRRPGGGVARRAGRQHACDATPPTEPVARATRRTREVALVEGDSACLILSSRPAATSALLASDLKCCRAWVIRAQAASSTPVQLGRMTLARRHPCSSGAGDTASGAHVHIIPALSPSTRAALLANARNFVAGGNPAHIHRTPPAIPPPPSAPCRSYFAGGKWAVSCSSVRCRAALCTSGDSARITLAPVRACAALPPQVFPVPRRPGLRVLSAPRLAPGPSTREATAHQQRDGQQHRLRGRGPRDTRSIASADTNAGKTGRRKREMREARVRRILAWKEAMAWRADGGGGAGEEQGGTDDVTHRGQPALARTIPGAGARSVASIGVPGTLRTGTTAAKRTARPHVCVCTQSGVRARRMSRRPGHADGALMLSRHMGGARRRAGADSGIRGAARESRTSCRASPRWRKDSEWEPVGQAWVCVRRCAESGGVGRERREDSGAVVASGEESEKRAVQRDSLLYQHLPQAYPDPSRCMPSGDAHGDLAGERIQKRRMTSLVAPWKNLLP